MASPEEISFQRSCDPSHWDPHRGRLPPTRKRKLDASGSEGSNDQAIALNSYLDTIQAKAHEARHTLIMGGKPVTSEQPLKNLLHGRENGERPRMLLEIFQHHNDRVKELVGIEYSVGTLTKVSQPS